MHYLNLAQNYEKAIENYETLVRLFPADDSGHGNLALAYTKAGNLPRAVTEVSKALEVYPKNSLQRYNYAMYSMYAGDFTTAMAQATRLLKDDPKFEYFYLPLAISNLARGDAPAARDTWNQLAQVSALGASFAALGQADADMYFGQYQQAIARLRERGWPRISGTRTRASRRERPLRSQKPPWRSASALEPLSWRARPRS